MKTNKTPKIRFKEFTNDWEQRELGELGSVAMNKRIFKDETSEIGDVPFFKIGTFGSEPDAYISRELFEEYKAKYPYPEIGDILISASGSIGRTVVYQGEDEYFQDSNIVWLKHDHRLNNAFLKQFYSIVKWKGLEGSTIKRLYNKNILETEISVPTPNEQRKVGSFFGQLDNLITLHQCKLEKLKNIKKSMIEKMFPKNGEKVPEIRFKEFTNDWEPRKFGDENDLITGYPFKSDKFSEDGIKLVRGMNVKRGYLDFSEEICMRWNSSLGLENYLLADNDILIQMDGALIGKSYAKIKENQLPALLVQRVTRARTKKEKADSNFMYQTIQRDFLTYIGMNKTETAVPHLSLNDIRDFKIMVPEIEEQKRIGEYLTNLDSLITLHQRELEKLKNIKKCMLEKMFV